MSRHAIRTACNRCDATTAPDSACTTCGHEGSHAHESHTLPPTIPNAPWVVYRPEGSGIVSHERRV